MSTPATDGPSDTAISPSVFAAVIATVGAVVGLLALTMICVFIILCVRELLKRRAKQGQDTDKVGLLKDRQEDIVSDQEVEDEVITSDIDHSVAIVKVDTQGESSSRPSVRASLVNGSKVAPAKNSSSTSTPQSSTLDSLKESTQDDELTCTMIDDDMEDVTGGNDQQSLIRAQQGSTRKVMSVDAGEVQIRAQKVGRSFSFMREMNKSFPVTPGVIVQYDFSDDSSNPLVRQYKGVPTNAVDHLDLLPAEKTKNRYRNVLPNPHSKVPLADTGSEGSTYINANFIRDLYGEEKAYIAAQGPLFDTMGDFWRMVWEQDVSMIVMLTGLIERGRHKCAKYWPLDDNQPIVYGAMEVTNVGEEKVPSCYTVAYLNVRNIKTGEQRTVYHFWCTAWPDFGIPKHTDPILKLRSVVNSHRTPKTGPIVVHCSAGLGRSGTFIAIDMGIQQYEGEGVVDPLKYMCEMRQDRGGMIQTSDQYLFVHKTLADYMK